MAGLREVTPILLVISIILALSVGVIGFKADGVIGWLDNGLLEAVIVFACLGAAMYKSDSLKGYGKSFLILSLLTSVLYVIVAIFKDLML